MTEQVTEPTYNQLHRLGKDDDDRRHGREPKRHHTVVAYQVGGRVDEGALHEAWLSVQQDYPVLRTRFERAEAGWRWVTDEPTPPAGLRRDRAADLAAAHQLAQQWADRRFDLAAEPLARLVLIEVDDQTHVLVLVAEHLVCDGWSTQCLLGRLSESYAELCGRGTRSPLECESYLDQARYERAQIAALDTEDISRLREQVLPALPIVEPAEVDHLRCTSVRLSYPRDRLAAAARRELGPFGASALVHAAAQRGLAMAFPPGPPATLLTMATRHRRPSRSAVGWYVNKVPVASAPADEPPAAFGHRLATALDRHPVPWAWLLATARPEAFGRHASCPYAGFNAMAEVSRRVAGAATERPIGRLRKLAVDTGFWDAALMVSVDSSDAEVVVSVEAKQDFVAAPALAGFADRLDASLRSWIGPLAATGAPPGRAGRRERAWWLTSWCCNGAGTRWPTPAWTGRRTSTTPGWTRSACWSCRTPCPPMPAPRCWSASCSPAARRPRWPACCARIPGTAAGSGRVGAMSELLAALREVAAERDQHARSGTRPGVDATANSPGRPARWRRRCGRPASGPARTVLLSMRPDGAGIAAMWGCWLAGASFVPIEQRAPQPRNLRIAELTGARVVLAERPVPLPGLTSVVTPAGTRPARRPRRRSWSGPSRGTGTDPGYVLFTSGSTGTPNGVAVAGGGVAGALPGGGRVRGTRPRRHG